MMGLGPDLMVVVCGGVFILPFFLFSATAGQVADKYPKDKLMRIIKAFEIVIMLVGTYGFITENLIVLVSSLFFMGLQSAFFGPVKYSILPELVDEDELVEGNALVEMGTFLAILIGTIVGGVAIALDENAEGVVSLLIILIAVVGYIFSRFIRPLKPINPNRKIDFGLIKPSIETLKITKKIQSVFYSVIGISWFWFLGAALLSIFPIYAKEVLRGPENLVTLFLAVFSVGVAVGAILCEKMSKDHLELGLVPIGSIGMSLFLIDLYFIGTPNFVVNTGTEISMFFQHLNGVRLLLDLFFFSAFGGLFTVPLYTFIQQRSELNDRSTVIAGNNILNALFMVVASLFLMGLLAAKISIPTFFLIFAVLNLLVAGFIYTVVPEFFWRLVCVIFSRILYKFSFSGAENIPKEGGVIITCNHVSFIDWLFIAAAIKRPTRFVMYYTFMKIPIVKYFFTGSKVIPIAGRKEDPQLMEEAFRKISEELKDGQLVCIFPEGEITRDGKLCPFRQGIERALEENPVPVIPITLDGLWGSFFSRRYGAAGT
jgi:1-acyl-sn-glycerol-3-phosphate acyltransferase